MINDEVEFELIDRGAIRNRGREVFETTVKMDLPW